MEMTAHAGHKFLKSTPMTRGEYKEFRGWKVPENENPDDDGFLVEYEPDGVNPPNVPGFDGYVSWSPEKVFTEAYRKTTSMTFSSALEALKRKMKVARTGWNGKGMYLFIARIGDFETDADISDMCVNADAASGKLAEVFFHDSIAMKTADGSVCMGWLASQVDMLAEDWTVV